MLGICEGVYFRIFFPDSEAMGFLLQLAISCLHALSTQIAGTGAGALSWLRAWWRRVPVPGLALCAGRRCWCCELAARVVETGC